MDDLFSDRAILRDRTLVRADVERLAGADSFAHVIDCDFKDADLSGLDMSRWMFDRCQMRSADFTGAKLEATQWRSCRGGFANFTAADLSEVQIISCDFNNSAWRRARLSAAQFDRCKLTGADLTDAAAMDLCFTETLLINARLPGFSFHKQTLSAIDFGQADLRKCDFRGATFDGCSLRDANVTGCRFDGADLRGADLGGIRLVDAGLFRGATISRQQAGQLLGELGLNVR